MTKDGAVKFSKVAKTPRAYFLFLLAGSIWLSGCGWIVQLTQEAHLRGYDRDIQNGTHAIDTAHNDAERAKAYSQRGIAYSEKARYSRVFKLIPPDEYERLFALALKDHDQAIALNPASADLYYNRGEAYYARAALDLTGYEHHDPWFDHAAADFEVTTEKDPHNFMAFDMLGLTHEQNDEWDEAIHDYTREMALNPLGKERLAGAWCGRGQHDQTGMKFETAVADYENSIAVDPTPQTDGCECESYDALLGLYIFQTHQYDKGWDLVKKAQASHQRISPELVDELKKASGRTS